MDLCNGWVETSGYGSVNGPICPYCSAQGKPSDAGQHGIGNCFFCGKHYRWVAGQTPVGFAWQTWQMEGQAVSLAPKGNGSKGG